MAVVYNKDSASIAAGMAATQWSRWTPSGAQISVLEDNYQRNAYPDGELRATLAMALGIEARQVQVWLQNRRQKEAKKAAMAAGASRAVDDHLPTRAMYCTSTPSGRRAWLLGRASTARGEQGPARAGGQRVDHQRRSDGRLARHSGGVDAAPVLQDRTRDSHGDMCGGHPADGV